MNHVADPSPSESSQPAKPDLARLMQAGTPGHGVFREDELAAILRHQLSTPVEFDLASLDRTMAAKLRMLADGHGLLVRSFRDLLLHPHPPIELLRMTKQFAKSCHNHPDSPLPEPIASLLYFCSIVAALLRCRQRITAMDDATLARGVRSLLEQSWLDEGLRGLLSEWLSTVQGADPP